MCIVTPCSIIGLFIFKSNITLFIISTCITPIVLIFGCIIFRLMVYYFNYDSSYKYNQQMWNKYSGCCGYRRYICPCCMDSINDISDLCCECWDHLNERETKSKTQQNKYGVPDQKLEGAFSDLA